MATAKRKQQPQPDTQAPETNKPVIQYFGEGAENVKFEIDPRAVLIKVYADGRISVDY